MNVDFKFITILISLALTNANFYAMIRSLETNNNAQEKRLDKIEAKIFSEKLQNKKGTFTV
jgi:hypothetical protein